MSTITKTFDRAAVREAARRLQAFLSAGEDQRFKFKNAYEGVAQVLGYANWNTLEAELSAGQRDAAAVPQMTGGSPGPKGWAEGTQAANTLEAELQRGNVQSLSVSLPEEVRRDGDALDRLKGAVIEEFDPRKPLDRLLTDPRWAGRLTEISITGPGLVWIELADAPEIQLDAEEAAFATEGWLDCLRTALGVDNGDGAHWHVQAPWGMMTAVVGPNVETGMAFSLRLANTVSMPETVELRHQLAALTRGHSLLIGPPGCGKTVMANRIAAEAVRQGGTTLLLDVHFGSVGLAALPGARWIGRDEDPPASFDPGFTILDGVGGNDDAPRWAAAIESFVNTAIAADGPRMVVIHDAAGLLADPRTRDVYISVVREGRRRGIAMVSLLQRAENMDVAAGVADVMLAQQRVMLFPNEMLTDEAAALLQLGGVERDMLRRRHSVAWNIGRHALMRDLSGAHKVLDTTELGGFEPPLAAFAGGYAVLEDLRRQGKVPVSPGRSGN